MSSGMLSFLIALGIQGNVLPNKEQFCSKKSGGKGKGLQLPVLWIIGAVSSAATRHFGDWVWKLNGFQVPLTHTMKFSVQSAVLSLAATPSFSRGYLLMTDKNIFVIFGKMLCPVETSSLCPRSDFF